MMAGLFAIFTLAFLAIFFSRRSLAISLIVAGILLTLAMFWHHATDVLKINL